MKCLPSTLSCICEFFYFRKYPRCYGAGKELDFCWYNGRVVCRGYFLLIEVRTVISVDGGSFIMVCLVLMIGCVRLDLNEA